MKIRLNRLQFPVETLGHGRRVGLWLQGCSLHCKGCISKDTWDEEGGVEIEVEDLLAHCQSDEYSDADGVTITGGEPFQQSEALHAFLTGMEPWRSRGAGRDILCYTGYRFSWLQRKYAGHLAKIDAVACGPYRDKEPSSDPLLGSGNQSLVALTDIGRERYVIRRRSEPRKLQFSIDGKTLWFVGIPKQGDMERLRQMCLEKGLELEGASWAP